MNVTLMGSLLGTARYEDQGGRCYSYPGFVPSEGVPIPAGTLTIDIDSGEWACCPPSRHADMVQGRIGLLFHVVEQAPARP